MKKLFLLFIFIHSVTIVSQNGSPTCDSAEPACSDNTGVKIFPNVTNEGDQGVFGCLEDSRNGAWFYIKVGQTGKLDFKIIQSENFDANGNPTGVRIDVDFIAWGPFTTSDSNCNNLDLNCGAQICPNNTENPAFYLNNQDGTNIIDCSYSEKSTETITIPNAQEGEFYVLLITNYSNPDPSSGDPPGGREGEIKLEQTNFGTTGAGTTDCSIITGDLGADQEICNDTTVVLDGTTTNQIVPIDTYEWQLDTGSGFATITGQTNATLEISNNVSGTYKLIVTDTADIR